MCQKNQKNTIHDIVRHDDTKQTRSIIYIISYIINSISISRKTKMYTCTCARPWMRYNKYDFYFAVFCLYISHIAVDQTRKISEDQTAFPSGCQQQQEKTHGATTGDQPFGARCLIREITQRQQQQQHQKDHKAKTTGTRTTTITRTTTRRKQNNKISGCFTCVFNFNILDIKINDWLWNRPAIQPPGWTRGDGLGSIGTGLCCPQKLCQIPVFYQLNLPKSAGKNKTNP